MIRGKVAFVTGATSGTGKAVALSLARQGVNIAAFDRWENDGVVGSTRKLNSLKREIRQMGVRCLTLCGDAMKDIDVMVAVAEAVVEFRRIDILFNDATAQEVPSNGQAGDAADITFKRMWLAARHVIPRMLKHGEGTVITCATAIGNSQQRGGWTLYGVASPFEDIGNTNIKISAICPALSAGVTRNLQQDGWTQLLQCNDSDLVTAIRDLVDGAVTTRWQSAKGSPWRA